MDFEKEHEDDVEHVGSSNLGGENIDRLDSMCLLSVEVKWVDLEKIYLNDADILSLLCGCVIAWTLSKAVAIWSLPAGESLGVALAACACTARPPIVI